MGTICFHSPSGDAKLWGGERRLMCRHVNTIAWGVVHEIAWHHLDELMELLPEDRRINEQDMQSPRERKDRALQSLYYFLTSIMSEGKFKLPDRQIGGLELSLNTALAMGNDVIKMCARIDGQCENHCWVDGIDRAWLATIIEDGLGSGLLREKMDDLSTGWRDAIDLLQQSEDEPVVLSYSVCESFPNPWICGWEGDRAEDWYNLDDDTKWGLAMDALRKDERGLQLTPLRWSYPKYWFGGSPPFNAQDLWQHVADKAAEKIEKGEKVS